MSSPLPPFLAISFRKTCRQGSIWLALVQGLRFFDSKGF
jgi:hypothetical protein